MVLSVDTSVNDESVSTVQVVVRGSSFDGRLLRGMSVGGVPCVAPDVRNSSVIVCASLPVPLAWRSQDV